MKKVVLTREEMPIADVLGTPQPESVGAVVSFLGTVRGGDVRWLEVEVDEKVALFELEELRRRAIERYSLIDAVIVHRYGRLEAGENIVLICAAAEHRRAAFDGCRYIIDEIKRTIPIWKKEHTEQGERWVEG